MWVYFWAFYLVAFVYISVFMPVSHYFDDCSFVLQPEVRKLDSSSSNFFLKTALALLSLLCFDMNCGNFCSSSVKNAIGNLISQSVSSVTHSCPTLRNLMNCSTPGLPVHHQLQEFTQTHVPRVGDAIQPSHPLSSPSVPAPSPSQHQGLFQ